MQPRSSQLIASVKLRRMANKLVELFDPSNLLTSFLLNSTVLCYEAVCTYVRHVISLEQTIWHRSVNFGKRMHVDKVSSYANFSSKSSTSLTSFQRQIFKSSALRGSYVKISLLSPTQKIASGLSIGIFTFDLDPF